MKSLKAKFGKFAISQTEAKKVQGGTPPKPNIWWMADCGGSLYAAPTVLQLHDLIRRNGGMGCSMIQ